MRRGEEEGRGAARREEEGFSYIEVEVNFI